MSNTKMSQLRDILSGKEDLCHLPVYTVDEMCTAIQATSTLCGGVLLRIARDRSSPIGSYMARYCIAEAWIPSMVESEDAVKERAKDPHDASETRYAVLCDKIMEVLQDSFAVPAFRKVLDDTLCRCIRVGDTFFPQAAIKCGFATVAMLQSFLDVFPFVDLHNSVVRFWECTLRCGELLRDKRPFVRAYDARTAVLVSILNA
jgi:hypothetical protein